MGDRFIRIAVSFVLVASLLLTASEVQPAMAVNSETAKVPLYEGLGGFGRKVTTKSAEAQRYFDQGLCFLYAFNHDEAIRSFQQATRLDPKCAMAWWGISLANGPHINNPVLPPERAAAAWKALQEAKACAENASEVERDLIAALSKRYADPNPEDRVPLDTAYADAMRDVAKKYADDADVGALFAESMMDLRPWDLWLPTGEAQPGTDEIVATIERVLAKSPNHPLALHLYIHAVEASPNPQRAVAPADRLRELQPGLGHLVHMPSHIDVRTGDWLKSITANAKAIESDRRYREQAGKQGFYHLYMAHNHHMLSYSAIMRGQSELAIKHINQMLREVPEDWAKENAMIADGFVAMPLEVLIRFGRWDEVLAAPEPAEIFPIARTLRHAARGIAFAAKGDVKSARDSQKAFHEAKAKVLPEAIVGNNKAGDVLNVAEHLLAGEILIRDEKLEEGLAELRTAVKFEDSLRYSEPPDWMHPVRHALGATLLTHDRPVEAEEVYRADLAKMPRNGWSLYGLARSLHLQEKTTESQKYLSQFDDEWRDADVKIRSSCFCQPGK